MKIKKFKKIYDLIGFYKHGNEKVMPKLMSIDDLTPLYHSYTDELNINLITANAKESVIRYYMSELRQIQHFFKDIEEFNNESDLYKQKAHSSYIVIYNELQIACNTNQIDFFKLCNEVEVNTETFDSAISLFYSGELSQFEEEKQKTKLSTKHYVLTYILNSYAKGKSLPNGEKVVLEHIGNKIMGAGKGNTFYKNFNLITSKDLNSENVLIEIAGEDWRNTVKSLSENPEILEKYLQSKQL